MALGWPCEAFFHTATPVTPAFFSLTLHKCSVITEATCKCSSLFQKQKDRQTGSTLWSSATC